MGTRDRGNQEATVFVGDLDEQVDEALLWELMLQCAPVASVYIPKDRVTGEHQGYGFVEFASQDDVEYAIKIMNMVNVFGRSIRVNKSQQSSSAKDMDIGANLFVGNLDDEVDEKYLHDAFSRFGFVVTAKVMRDQDTGQSRGFGFVNYDSFEGSDAAIAALDGQYLANKPINVTYALKRGSTTERHGTDAERLLAARRKALIESQRPTRPVVRPMMPPVAPSPAAPTAPSAPAPGGMMPGMPQPPMRPPGFPGMPQQMGPPGMRPPMQQPMLPQQQQQQQMMMQQMQQQQMQQMQQQMQQQMRAPLPGFPGGPPRPGMPPQGMQPQGMPQPGMAQRLGMPPQGMPPQGMPPQGMAPPRQGIPPQKTMPPQGTQPPRQGMPLQSKPPQGNPPQGPGQPAQQAVQQATPGQNGVPLARPPMQGCRS